MDHDAGDIGYENQIRATGCDRKCRRSAVGVDIVAGTRFIRGNRGYDRHSMLF